MAVGFFRRCLATDSKCGGLYLVILVWWCNSWSYALGFQRQASVQTWSASCWQVIPGSGWRRWYHGMCQICTLAGIISDSLLQICESGFAMGIHICAFGVAYSCPPEHIPEIGHNHEIAHLLYCFLYCREISYPIPLVSCTETHCFTYPEALKCCRKLLDFSRFSTDWEYAERLCDKDSRPGSGVTPFQILKDMSTSFF